MKKLLDVLIVVTRICREKLMERRVHLNVEIYYQAIIEKIE